MKHIGMGWRAVSRFFDKGRPFGAGAVMDSGELLALDTRTSPEKGKVTGWQRATRE